MRVLVFTMLVMLASAACEDAELDPGVKVECESVLKHIVQISPQGKTENPDAIVAALPIEDLQACGATEREVRSCMLLAPDVDGLKKCLPSDAVLKCMRTAAAAKNAALAQAKAKHLAEKDVNVKPFDDARAKCWAGDPKAADAFKTE